jgi:hypothetical protein
MKIPIKTEKTNQESTILFSPCMYIIFFSNKALIELIILFWIL